MKDRLMIFSVIAFVLTICVAAGSKSKEIAIPVKLETKKVHYLAFDKKHFAKKGSIQSMSMGAKYAIATAMGGKLHHELSHINGFVVELDGDKPKVVDLPAGWVVQEDQIYHVPLAVRYEKVEDLICPNGQAPTCQSAPLPIPQCPACPVCPGPTPGPGPTPTPDPTPTPAFVDWGVKQLHSLEAEALVDTSTIKIGVIDTGVDMNHPDKPTIFASISMVAGSPVQDQAGHGTHCVGIISTSGNRIASNSKAQIAMCKGLDDQGSGMSSDLANCEVWMAQQHPDAVSMSWGSTQSDPAINQGVSTMVSAGIEVFIAAGNSGLTSNPNLGWPAQLACANSHVHAVTSMNQSGQMSNFSSHGPCASEIAPGENITSLKANSQGYVSMSGTSMATPAAAAMWAYAKKTGHGLRYKSLGLPQTSQGAGQPDALLISQ